MLDNYRHIHFIGIGGSGISALAYLANAHGLKVAGSDMSENPTTSKLKAEGVDVFVGQKAENLNELCELVVYTEAIDRETNPEYLAAKERGIETMSYFEALGQLSKAKKTVVVTGTHGKTTTTAMLGQALAEADMDPTVIVGSRVPAFDNRNIRIGRSQWLVAEGCEYRRSFLSLEPFGVILLNCELEHVDYYKSEEDYRKAFEELIAKVPTDGFLVYNQDDENCQIIAKTARCKVIGVSMNEAKDLEMSVPGDFNQLNALHALRAAEQIEADTTKVKTGLKSFKGTARRMEIKGERDGVLVMDDYGHHPTEVKATLAALKQAYPEKRLICVFQPHQYSRTHELIGDFKMAFDDAELVFIPNIYEARDTEEDKAKVSAKSLAETIKNAEYTESFEKTLQILNKTAKSSDLIVTMGAGDIYKVGESYL